MIEGTTYVIMAFGLRPMSGASDWCLRLNQEVSVKEMEVFARRLRCMYVDRMKKAVKEARYSRGEVGCPRRHRSNPKISRKQS